jgi:hypothetical protein
MAEILWHRRETRRQTENTNFGLNGGKAPAYSPISCLTTDTDNDVDSDFDGGKFGVSLHQSDHEFVDYF